MSPFHRDIAQVEGLPVRRRAQGAWTDGSKETHGCDLAEE
jgi:hypothetical protein